METHQAACDRVLSQAIVSPRTGRGRLNGNLPNVEWLRGDRGCDAAELRDVLKDKGRPACLPDRRQLKTTITYDKRPDKRPNRIEIKFGRLKDWRRVAT